MNDTLLRQWAMLRHIPRYPRKIDAGTLKDRLERSGYEITLRSIQRDLVRLSTALPLMADNGRPQGWSWRKDAEQIDLPFLEPQAALTFHLVERHMGSLLPESTLQYLAPWFRSARAVLEQNASGITTWPEKVRVLPRGLHLQAPVIDQEVHSTLYDALLDERQVNIHYLPRHAQEAKEYRVHPLGVVVRDTVLYLVCTVFDYTDIRQLALHRIKTAAILDDACRRPAGFTLDDYIATGGFGYTETGKHIELVADFSESAAAHLYECRLADDQCLEPLTPGLVRVRATVLDTLELRWWLLGFGDQVRVIAPTSLHDRMRAIAQNMASMYEGTETPAEAT